MKDLLPRTVHGLIPTDAVIINDSPSQIKINLHTELLVLEALGRNLMVYQNSIGWLAQI